MTKRCVRSIAWPSRSRSAISSPISTAMPVTGKRTITARRQRFWSKMGELPPRLLQNLCRRAVIVRLPVTGIAVLIGEEIALRLLLGQAMDLTQRFVIPLQGIRGNQPGAVRHNALAPFETGIFRHYQVHRVL